MSEQKAVSQAIHRAHSGAHEISWRYRLRGKARTGLRKDTERPASQRRRVSLLRRRTGIAVNYAGELQITQLISRWYEDVTLPQCTFSVSTEEGRHVLVLSALRDAAALRAPAQLSILLQNMPLRVQNSIQGGCVVCDSAICLCPSPSSLAMRTLYVAPVLVSVLIRQFFKRVALCGYLFGLILVGFDSHPAQCGI